MSAMMTGSVSGTASKMTSSLPATLAAAVKSTAGDWQAGGKMKRLWQHDASLWDRHLGRDLKAGLAALAAAVQKAL
jgi:hypothetical protein